MTIRRSITALAIVGLAACGDSEGGSITSTEVATIAVNEGARALSDGSIISVSVGTIAEGNLGRASELRISNNGEIELTIESIEVQSQPPGAFEVQSQDGSALPLGGENPVVIAPPSGDGRTNLFVNLMYLRTPENENATATLSIQSNSVLNGVRQERISFQIELAATGARLQVVPSRVDFGNVGQGDSEQKTISLLNQGSADLVVSSFILSGHPSFSFAAGGQAWPVSPETASVGVDLDPPIVVRPGESETVAARFEPTGPEPADAKLVLFSNDPDGGNAGTEVPLQGNVGGPCIAVNPKKVDFGGKLIGKPATVDVEITSCGDKDLEIDEIMLTPETSPDFGLALDSLPGVAPAQTVLGPADPPVVLAPNQSATFQVVFIPDSINVLDEGGQPIPDLGNILIRSNAFISELDVEIRGFGVEVECPTAVIIVQEGEEVIPQTLLHLIGSQSYAATGAIEEYRWSVQQPVGSQQIFVPSKNHPDPTFEANIAGTYVFRLEVTDSSGEDSCVAATATVVVNPDEAIHVELLWDTPNDPDQTDEGPVAGADLDLHFVHPFGTGGYDGDGDGELDGYFDEIFDAFWFHSEPNWGSLSPDVDDNPSLDRDDTDGAGPENINLDGPESGLSYKIGVHYWNDHGFGPSYATVRVFIYANLVFELADVELINQDMWTVGHVNWPQGSVTKSQVCEGVTPPQPCADSSECAGECVNRIFGPYRHPFFPSD